MNSINPIALQDPNLLAAMRKRMGVPQSAPVADSAPVSAMPRIGELPQEQPLPVARHAVEPLSTDELYAGGANMPRISAEAAPQAVQSPVTRRGPLPETIQAGQQSDNPMVQRSATGAALGAYAPYVQSGPAQQRLDASTEPDEPPRHGLWNKTKHVLGGIGKGFMLGGLGGAIAGGISPGTADRAVYRGIERPRLQAEADRERQLQQQQLGDVIRVGEQTGTDLSGQPNAVTRHRLATEAETASRNRMMDENRDMDRAVRMRGQDFTNDYRKVREQQFQQKLAQGEYVHKVGTDGNLYAVHRSDPTAPAVLVERADHQPIGSFQEAEEKGKNYRAAESQAGADRRTGAGIASREREGEKNRTAASERQRAHIEAGKYRSRRGGGGSLRDKAAAATSAEAGAPSSQDPRLGKRFKDKQGNYVIVDAIGADGQPSKWHAAQ